MFTPWASQPAAAARAAALRCAEALPPPPPSPLRRAPGALHIVGWAHTQRACLSAEKQRERASPPSAGAAERERASPPNSREHVPLRRAAGRAGLSAECGHLRQAAVPERGGRGTLPAQLWDRVQVPPPMLMCIGARGKEEGIVGGAAGRARASPPASLLLAAPRALRAVDALVQLLLEVRADGWLERLRRHGRAIIRLGRRGGGFAASVYFGLREGGGERERGSLRTKPLPSRAR